MNLQKINKHKVCIFIRSQQLAEKSKHETNTNKSSSRISLHVSKIPQKFKFMHLNRLLKLGQALSGEVIQIFCSGGTIQLCICLVQNRASHACLQLRNLRTYCPQQLTSVLYWHISCPYFQFSQFYPPELTFKIQTALLILHNTQRMLLS